MITRAPGFGVAVDHDAREDNLQWMAETGESAVGAAKRLGIGREGLEGWCRKRGRMDLFVRLAARDPIQLRRNQHDEEWAS